MKVLGKEHWPTSKSAMVAVWWTLPFLEPDGEESRGFFQPHDLAECLALIDRGSRVLLPASETSAHYSCLGGLNPLVAQIMEARPDCPILTVGADRLAGVIKYGPPLQGKTAGVDQVRRALYDLGEEIYRLRPGFEEHLGVACIRGLKKKWFGTILIDGFQDGRILQGGQLLAASWRLADWIKSHIPEKRVGILLPPGLGATIANLACTLADVTAVNLNFTAGRLVNESCLQRAEISTLITAEAMKTKVKDFPWPARTFDIKELLLGFPKASLAWRWLVGLLLPADLLRLGIGVPGKGGDREAALLFTSGSVGEPKGVVLTHRNLLANVRQIDAVLSTGPIKSLLACLPIFHSFGYTVTFWWPLLGGPMAITYVSPMETAKLIELIDRYKIDLFINTPTFLRNFLRKAQPGQLQSLKIVVTGAEKLPLDLRSDFEAKFHLPVCEGYGMTEASPVVAVNLVGFAAQPGTPEYEAPRRISSVGRLVPGISIRVRDPETQSDLPLNQTGMIWLKGANLFSVYLHAPDQTARVLVDGWYCTGDLGRLDPDGFLVIEGRLSRFSKIAGEMVPHGVVEEKLNEIYRREYGEDFLAAVVGRPDVAKGECLLALVNHPVEFNSARIELVKAGLPNLWLPKDYLVTDSVPLLATGKLDIKACQKMVEHLMQKKI